MIAAHEGEKLMLVTTIAGMSVTMIAWMAVTLIASMPHSLGTIWVRWATCLIAVIQVHPDVAGVAVWSVRG